MGIRMYMRNEINSMSCLLKNRVGSSVTALMMSSTRHTYKAGLRDYNFSTPLESSRRLSCFASYIWKSAKKFGAGAYTNPITKRITFIIVIYPCRTGLNISKDVQSNVLPCMQLCSKTKDGNIVVLLVCMRISLFSKFL